MAWPAVGKDGAVYIGANVVAMVTDWNYSESRNIIEAPYMGASDDKADMLVGFRTGAGGTVSCVYNGDDTNGQLAFITGITGGAAVTLDLYAEGLGNNLDEFAGAVYASGMSVSQSQDGVATISFDFTGFLTRAAQVVV